MADMSVSSASSAMITEIPPQSGTAFSLQAGDVLRVIDPWGEQVAGLTAFALDDRSESLSSGRSIEYAETIYLTSGHTLYSNRSRPMFAIVRDDVGRHDFLLTPCSREKFVCLTGHGIDSDALPTTFNIFMNLEIDPAGRIAVRAPRSRGGDCIEFRAEMDLVIGLTACSAELSNNDVCKPIWYSIDRGSRTPWINSAHSPAP
jgi:uncharacterized protein YcgI (DUF1989 family)